MKSKKLEKSLNGNLLLMKRRKRFFLDVTVLGLVRNILTPIWSTSQNLKMQKASLPILFIP